MDALSESNCIFDRLTSEDPGGEHILLISFFSGVTPNIRRRTATRDAKYIPVVGVPCWGHLVLQLR